MDITTKLSRGTALFGQDATQQVTTAIDNGLTHLDAAQAYDNEQTVGKGIKGLIYLASCSRFLTRQKLVAAKTSPQELFITTKLRESETRSVKETLIESLSKLGVDQVGSGHIASLMHESLSHV